MFKFVKELWLFEKLKIFELNYYLISYLDQISCPVLFYYYELYFVFTLLYS
jgi:hypothetical protein